MKTGSKTVLGDIEIQVENVRQIAERGVAGQLDRLRDETAILQAFIAEAMREQRVHILYTH